MEFEFEIDNALYILFSPKRNVTEPNDLTGFPFEEGQFVSGIEDCQDHQNCDHYWVIVDLGEYTDTNILQEQALNTNSRVIEYHVS